jgi:protease-4
MVGLTAGLVLLAREEFAPSVETDSFLEVTINGGIGDAPQEGGLFMDPSDFPPLATEVAAGIRDAAEDSRIKGLYLEIDGVGLGWGSTQELRDALVAFTASGKPCYAYAPSFDNKSYYLATGCKEIYLPPAGVSLVTGLSVTTEYYAGIFEKLGVQANFEHVGDFKSAVEPYTRPGPSEPAIEATSMLMGSLYDQLIAGIASGRGMEIDAARALVENPPITAPDALAAGLINGLKYRDEVEDLIGENRTTIEDYIGSQGSGLSLSSKKIAVIHAEGAIVDGESGQPFFGGRMVGDRTLGEYFEEARENEDVVAVVLRVNSPGGSGSASDMIWRDVERVQASGKPVVVSMGDYAASGGYYISAGADKIIAQPGTITGSIGVFGGKINIKGIYDQLGITTYTWKKGEMSGLFSEIENFSDPERAKFRSFLEGFYDVFLIRVADGRHMSKEAVHTVAQGRVWTGEQALERGLVDELGGLDLAIERAKELASVSGDIEITRLPRQKTLMEQLVEDFEGGNASINLPGVKEAIGEAFMLERVLSGGVAALLPGHLEIK